MTEKAKKLATKRIKSSFLEGINLREYFAGLAMQGILAKQFDMPKENINDTIKSAMEYADALLEELAKEN